MHLTIIAKAPVAGSVKTRLCPPCTPRQAAAVARASLEDTFEAVQTIAATHNVEPVLLLAGDPQPWMPSMRIVGQRGDALGERLANGFADLGSGVIVGMETPHVVPHLAGAFHALRSGTEVLGLATDGGYWCIGLSPAAAETPYPLFAGVPMSRSNTGVAQLRRLHAAGRSVHLLRAARDLDDAADVVAVARSTRTGRLADMARALVESDISPAFDAVGH